MIMNVAFENFELSTTLANTVHYSKSIGMSLISNNNADNVFFSDIDNVYK
jgi:hypothetical protein